MSYDEHGHPELVKFRRRSSSTTCSEGVSEINLKVKRVPWKSATTCAAKILLHTIHILHRTGHGVFELFQKGETACMVYVDHNGEAHPLYLRDLQSPTEILRAA